MIVPQIWVQWSPRSPWGTAPSSGIEGQSLRSASCCGSNICVIQEFELFVLLYSFWAFLLSYTQFSFWVEFSLNWLFWAVHSNLKTDITNFLTQGAARSSPWGNINISCKNCLKRQTTGNCATQGVLQHLLQTFMDLQKVNLWTCPHVTGKLWELFHGHA